MTTIRIKVKRRDSIMRPRNPMPHLKEFGFCSKNLLKLYEEIQKAIIDNTICEKKLIKQTVPNFKDIVSPIAFLPAII